MNFESTDRLDQKNQPDSPIVSMFDSLAEAGSILSEAETRFVLAIRNGDPDIDEELILPALQTMAENGVMLNLDLTMYTSRDFTKDLSEAELANLVKIKSNYLIKSGKSGPSATPQSSAVQTLLSASVHATNPPNTRGARFENIPRGTYAEVSINGATFRISDRELQRFADGEMSNGFNEYVTFTSNRVTLNYPNAARLIVPSDSEAFANLYSQFTGNTHEATVQNALNWFSESIRYSVDDANRVDANGYEVNETPLEVIATLNSDCSGSTGAFASMLEHLPPDQDYLIVYFEGHVGLAVTGDFPSENGLSFVSGGRVYHYIETTGSGTWRIGVDPVNLVGNDHPFTVADILFVQDPDNGRINTSFSQFTSHSRY